MVTGAAQMHQVYLNPAMEVVNPKVMMIFGGLDTIARLVEELAVPVIVKETGCGLSRAVDSRSETPAQWVDTSGPATSWVEEDNASRSSTRPEILWIGASHRSECGLLSGRLHLCNRGVSNAYDRQPRYANCCGIARPFLQAHARWN